MKMKSCVFLCSAILYGLFLEPVSGVMVKIKTNGVRNKRYSETEAEHEEFMIPKTLKLQDRIEVTGNMTEDWRGLIVSLVTHSKETNSRDLDNIACRVHAVFHPDPDNQDKDKENMYILVVINGEHQKPLPAGFTNNTIFTTAGPSGKKMTVFEVSFLITGSEEDPIIELGLNKASTMNDCTLQHNLKDIKYLTLGGHIHTINEINFKLA